MTAPFRTFSLALLCMAGTANAIPYDSGIVHMEIPAGFEGPVTQQPTMEATVGAFVKHYPSDTRGTLIEITTYEFGAKLRSMPDSERIPTMDRYLEQFLGGVERKRTAFTSTSPVHVTIGGLSASRATWNGVAQGQNMSGVMYCVIVGGVVVVFHTQDFDDAPPENRAAAIRSIESAVFGRHT